MRSLLSLSLLALGFGLASPVLAFSLSPYPLPLVGPDPLPLILAQSNCYTKSCDAPVASGDSDPALPPPPPGVAADAVGITPEKTAWIVDQIQTANRYCQEKYEPGYIIDCVARAYEQIGRSLPYRSGYGPMRNALLQTGVKLHDWAIKNADPTKEGRMGRSTPQGPEAFLRPVKRTPKANAEASAIIAEAQVVLLRSASGSEQRRIAFEQVANVVGSTVVLLRSARRKRRRAWAQGSGRPAPVPAGLRTGFPAP